MNLPELEWQIIYGRIAWSVVLTALGIAILQHFGRTSRTAVSLLLASAMLFAVLPGESSISFWLGLAFQWPSGLLFGLCLVKLHLTFRGSLEKTVMPVTLSVPIVLGGALLYLDAIGILSLGIYYVGFEPVFAPLLALMLAIASSAVAVIGKMPSSAFALLLAAAMFMLLRLPTGNLWDSLLDPLLWTWSLVSLCATGLQWRRQYPVGHPKRE
ncbi:hypothetical protein ACFQUU_05585 [Herbaspirillum sp. GCM10030257]|uniref:hypothetical protein n=1 Tax=Herbaspirillum sp. GCM10030257 TaxID=3273393 RepID=UPI00360DE352